MTIYWFLAWLGRLILGPSSPCWNYVKRCKGLKNMGKKNERKKILVCNYLLSDCTALYSTASRFLTWMVIPSQVRKFEVVRKTLNIEGKYFQVIACSRSVWFFPYSYKHSLEGYHIRVYLFSILVYAPTKQKSSQNKQFRWGKHNVSFNAKGSDKRSWIFFMFEFLCCCLMALHAQLKWIFKESALWADSFYNLKWLFVCLFVRHTFSLHSFFPHFLKSNVKTFYINQALSGVQRQYIFNTLVWADLSQNLFVNK